MTGFAKNQKSDPQDGISPISQKAQTRTHPLPATTPPAPSIHASPARFFNRELSWLAFNQRVLEEAQNINHPLLERLRFLSISASNLDEFVMVRVAGLKAQVAAGITTPTADGLIPAQQLLAIDKTMHRLADAQQSCFRKIRAELRKQDIQICSPRRLSKQDHEWLKDYFFSELYPQLTPIAVDPAHPFPFIPNKGAAIVLELFDTRKKRDLVALVPLPAQAKRFIRMPKQKDHYILIEDVILLFLDALFPDFEHYNHALLRVLRDSEMEIEEEAEDLVRTFESALKRRRRGNVIHLSVNIKMDHKLSRFLQRQLGVSAHDVFPVNGLIGLEDILELITDDRPDLLFEPYSPRFPERVRDFGGDCFAAIQAKDFVIHHPYESFDVVVQFLRQAARDPDVVAIKQTLYRTSAGSLIVDALIEAAEAGKSVTAMVELKARFDEEANIRWARDLERAGVSVVYGFIDYKTHAKISIAVRREAQGLRTYTHLGTGNYHSVTAKIYTDLSFFTDDEVIGRDTSAIFNYMTGYAVPRNLEKIALAPISLRQTLLNLINEEIAHAKAGRPAMIWAKMNALVDPALIDALYQASEVGVEIDLVIRGICCLRPGVPDLSENIRVKSIVGRFLEHSRIACFGNGDALPHPHAKVFISSADWMPRNLDRRIEVLVPIENETVHQQILQQIMVANLKDTQQSWSLKPNGNYERVQLDGRSHKFNIHSYFMNNPSLSGRGSAVKAHIGDDDPQKPLQLPPRLVLTEKNTKNKM